MRKTITVARIFYLVSFHFLVAEWNVPGTHPVGPDDDVRRFWRHPARPSLLPQVGQLHIVPQVRARGFRGRHLRPGQAHDRVHQRLLPLQVPEGVPRRHIHEGRPVLERHHRARHHTLLPEDSRVRAPQVEVDVREVEALSNVRSPTLRTPLVVLEKLPVGKLSKTI